MTSQVVTMLSRDRMWDFELGLRHVEILAIPSRPGDARLDLVCRLTRGGTFHHVRERVVVNGPPTCFWCLADRRRQRRAP